MSGVEFVGALPSDSRTSRHPDFWVALLERPGVWAVWPGRGNIYALAKYHSRNGVEFEGAMRGGTRYVRAMPR